MELKKFKKMMRLFRKWWALRTLSKASQSWGLNTLSALEIALGQKHAIAEEAIIKEIVNKSIGRLSWWLFLKRKDKEKTEKELSGYYSSVFKEAKRENLVYVIPDSSLRDKEVILNPPGRSFFYTTDLGDKFIAEFWYKVLKAVFFNAYATGIIIFIVVTYTGYQIKRTFNDISAPPVINVYPNIDNNYTPPEVKPIINIYPKTP